MDLLKLKKSATRRPGRSVPENALRRISEGLLEHGGRRFAVGLLWARAEDADHVDAEAKERARSEQLQADLYIVLAGELTQYGLGKLALGHTAGLSAGAAMLAEADARDVLAVYPLDDGSFWLVATRAGCVDAQTDFVYRDEEEAQIQLRDLLGQQVWDRVMAPAGWRIDGAEPPDLDLFAFPGSHKLKPARSQAAYWLSFLTRSSKEVRSSSLRMLMVPALVLLATGGGIGTKWYLSWKAEQDALERARVQRELEAKRARENRPWEKQIPSSAALAVCEHAALSAEAVIPGWYMERAVCDLEKRSFEMTWLRAGGTVPEGQYYFGGLGWEHGFDAQGDRAAASFPLAIQPPADGTGLTMLDDLRRREEILPLTEMANRIWGAMQGIGAEMKLEDRQAMEENAHPLVIWERHAWALRAMPPVSLLGLYLDRTPGVTVKRIEIDIERDRASSTWNIRGEAYRTKG
jgi:hypothetical protein